MAAAKAMSTNWPDNVYPLEWLCKIHIERASGTLEVEELDDVEEVSRRLQELAPTSPLGPLAEGAHLLEHTGRSGDAIAALKKGADLGGGSANVHGMLLLARALQVMPSSSGKTVLIFWYCRHHRSGQNWRKWQGRV